MKNYLYLCLVLLYNYIQNILKLNNKNNWNAILNSPSGYNYVHKVDSNNTYKIALSYYIHKALQYERLRKYIYLNNLNDDFLMFNTNILDTENIYKKCFNDNSKNIYQLNNNFYVYTLTTDEMAKENTNPFAEGQESMHAVVGIHSSGSSPRSEVVVQAPETGTVGESSSSCSILSRKPESVAYGWNREKNETSDLFNCHNESFFEDDTISQKCGVCSSVSLDFMQQEHCISESTSRSKIPVLKYSKSKTLVLKNKVSVAEEENRKKIGKATEVTKSLGCKKSFEAQTNSSPHEAQTLKPSKRRSFLRKFLNKQVYKVHSESPKKLPDTSKNTSTEIQTHDSIRDEIYLKDISINELRCSDIGSKSTPIAKSSRKDDLNGTAGVDTLTPYIPSSYIKQGNLALNMSLADAVQQVTDLYARVRESELYLMETLSKYIHDRKYEKQLLEAVTDYGRVHMAVERRAQHLAKELWMQQRNVNKTQEKSLQETVNSVVRQNRQLQENNENLLRINEKLSMSSRQSFENARSSYGYNKSLVESISRNNENLRCKVNMTFKQLDELEKELQKLQKTNEILEVHLNNYNAQVQNYKVLLQRNQTDNELQHADLLHQLNTNQKIINDSVEAGDVLLEDLDALKRQAKNVSCALNWTKFKCRGSSLADLLYMCRSYINELAKELMMCQNTNLLKDKDIDNAKEEINRLQGYINQHKLEIEKTNKKLHESEKQHAERQKFAIKYKSLENELHLSKKEMNEMIAQFAVEKNSLLRSFSHMEELNKQVAEKEEELLQARITLNQYKSENDTLRINIDHLNQIITTSGIGDMTKELASVQEKTSFFQSQFYQVLSEKNYLSEQLKSANSEREILAEYQQTYYQHLQNQQKDLEAISKDNLVLKEDLEKERQNVVALQNERVCYLEEKSVLKQIYVQFKNEIATVQKLEGKLAGMNLEANRLAIIAEYNRQLGEHLQSEVAERNEIITELQTNVQQLNNAQMEHTKDKVALCAELTQVYTVKEQLNSSLVVEIEKSGYLDEINKKVEDNANIKLKAAEDMQKAERAALKELLKEYKNIVIERDNIIASENENLQQISNLRAVIETQKKTIENVITSNYEAKEYIDLLEGKLTARDKEMQNSKLNLKSELKNLENTCTLQKHNIEQVKHENEQLKESVTYLQVNIRKLHEDLNDARKLELEKNQAMNKEIEKNKQMEQSLLNNNAVLEEAHNEIATLIKQNENVSDIYRKLLLEYECNINDWEQREQTLRKTMEESTKVIEETNKEIERLEHAVLEKDKQLIEYQEKCKFLQEQMEEYYTVANAQSSLLTLSNEEHTKLQNMYEELGAKHNKNLQKYSALKEQNQHLKHQLQEITQQREKDYSYYTAYMEEICSEYGTQRVEMQQDLQDLGLRLQGLSSDYIKEKHSYNELEEVHTELATKVLHAIRMLVEEKLARQAAEVKAVDISQQVLRLRSEKISLSQQVEIFSKELTDLKAMFNEVTEEKQNMQRALIDAQEFYKLSQEKSDALDIQLQETKKRYKESANILSNRHSEKKLVVLKETQTKLIATEDRNVRLKMDLEECHQVILQLKQNLAHLEQEKTALEFQKCEIALRLHEFQGKLSTEQSLNKELQELTQRILSTTLIMTENGTISHAVSDALLGLLHGEVTDQQT